MIILTATGYFFSPFPCAVECRHNGYYNPCRSLPAERSSMFPVFAVFSVSSVFSVVTIFFIRRLPPEKA